MKSDDSETQRDKKGKWPKVVEKLAKDNLLNSGRGDRLRTAIKDFRENFQMRDVFINDSKK